jgi:hypothetical protein
MTGPENYREAERLVDSAYRTSDQYGDGAEAARQDLMAAQVHATLALAAATALGREGSDGTQPVKDRAAWFDAAAECRKASAA